MVFPEEPTQADRDSTWVVPAEVHLSSHAAPSEGAASTTLRRSRKWAWIGCGLLAALLLGVGLVWMGRLEVSVPAPSKLLPTAVPPPAPALQRRTRPPTEQEEIQEMRMQLARRQRTLQEQGVETWAPTRYAAARQWVEAGNSAHQAHKFTQAVAYYRQALDKLQALQDASEQAVARLLERGQQALGEERAAARRAFQQALQLRPDSVEAEQGLRRAKRLEKRQALLAEGDRLLEQGRLEQARSRYRQAQKQDPQAEAVRVRLRELDRQTEVRAFRQAMSQGYAALAANNLEHARRAFSQAVKVNPEAADARSALRQVEQRLASAEITRLLAAAEALMEAEQWSEAAATYGEALALDPHLVTAQEGRAAAERRAFLSARINRVLAHPERLGDENVYQEADRLWRQAQQLDRPGPALGAQIEALEGLLERAATPVRVTLRSDNKTEVFLYRVGSLGKFETKEIELRPGRYVAVGIREGYRDVRTEFLVSAEESPPLVVVQVEESIPR